MSEPLTHEEIARELWLEENAMKTSKSQFFKLLRKSKKTSKRKKADCCSGKREKGYPRRTPLRC